jgi:hypothetical protein
LYSISYQYNIPLIIGGTSELKLFEQRPENTFMRDYDSLQLIQNKVIAYIDQGKDIDIDLKNAFKSAHQKALSNFNVTYIDIDT